MQTMNINVESVSRQVAQRCGNDVKLLGSVTANTTGFAWSALTIQVQSQIGSRVSYGFLSFTDVWNGWLKVSVE